jgi:hypothetical protein
MGTPCTYISMEEGALLVSKPWSMEAPDISHGPSLHNAGSEKAETIQKWNEKYDHHLRYRADHSSVLSKSSCRGETLRYFVLHLITRFNLQHIT